MAIVQTLIGNVKGPQGIQGIQGETGAAGSAATISVGTTSTTAYGNPASVTNVGSSSEAILNFVIPQGAPGETVTTMDDLALNTITTATAEYPYPAIGDTGKTIFGKIIKFFQDLVSKKVDTAAVVNNFTTTEAGYVADARTVNTLMESLSQLVVTEIKDMPAISFASGTVGSYATAISLNIAKTGYTPIQACFSQVGHLGQYNPTLALSENNVTVALYRVSTGTISQPEGDIKVAVTYVKS